MAFNILRRLARLDPRTEVPYGILLICVLLPFIPVAIHSGKQAIAAANPFYSARDFVEKYSTERGSSRTEGFVLTDVFYTYAYGSPQLNFRAGADDLADHDFVLASGGRYYDAPEALSASLACPYASWRTRGLTVTVRYISRQDPAFRASDRVALKDCP